MKTSKVKQTTSKKRGRKTQTLVNLLNIGIANDSEFLSKISPEDAKAAIDAKKFSIKKTSKKPKLTPHVVPKITHPKKAEGWDFTVTSKNISNWTLPSFQFPRMSKKLTNSKTGETFDRYLNHNYNKLSPLNFYVTTLRNAELYVSMGTVYLRLTMDLKSRNSSYKDKTTGKWILTSNYVMDDIPLGRLFWKDDPKEIRNARIRYARIRKILKAFDIKFNKAAFKDLMLEFASIYDDALAIYRDNYIPMTYTEDGDVSKAYMSARARIKNKLFELGKVPCAKVLKMFEGKTAKAIPYYNIRLVSNKEDGSKGYIVAWGIWKYVRFWDRRFFYLKDYREAFKFTINKLEQIKASNEELEKKGSAANSVRMYIHKYWDPHFKGINSQVDIDACISDLKKALNEVEVCAIREVRADSKKKSKRTKDNGKPSSGGFKDNVLDTCDTALEEPQQSSGLDVRKYLKENVLTKKERRSLEQVEKIKSGYAFTDHSSHRRLAMTAREFKNAIVRICNEECYKDVAIEEKAEVLYNNIIWEKWQKDITNLCNKFDYTFFLTDEFKKFCTEEQYKSYVYRLKYKQGMTYSDMCAIYTVCTHFLTKAYDTPDKQTFRTEIFFSELKRIVKNCLYDLPIKLLSKAKHFKKGFKSKALAMAKKVTLTIYNKLSNDSFAGCTWLPLFTTKAKSWIENIAPDYVTIEEDDYPELWSSTITA